MPRIESVLDYTVAPFSAADIDKPVTVIEETNDGVKVILLSNPLTNSLWRSASQDERGGIWVTKFNSLRDFFHECMDCADELGDFVYAVPDPEEQYGVIDATEEEFFEYVNKMCAGHDGMIMEGGIVTVTELSGSYLNPEELFNAF